MTKNTFGESTNQYIPKLDVVRGDRMKLINRRYRVTGVAQDGSPSLCYLAEDLLQESRPVVLRLIRPEAIPARALSYLKRELPALKGIAHPGIMHIFDFGVVQSIDGRNALSLQYYLTHEYIPAQRSVFQEYAGKKVEEILRAVVNICHVLGYLHDIGYVYGRLDENSVAVVDGPEGATIKLTRCVIDPDVEKAIFKARDASTQFSPPEQLRGDFATPASDLYSLGVLMLYLLTGEDPTEVSVSNVLHKHIETPHLKPFAHLTDRLIAPVERRYNDTRQVIAHINSITGAGYPLFDQNYKSKVISATKLVGRDAELQLLNDWKTQLLRKSRHPALTLVDGSMGIGKTRLLREFSFYMELERIRVFTASFSETRKLALEPIAQLIRNVIPLASDEILAKYGPELIKVVPDLLSCHDIQPTPELPAEREALRLSDRLANFLLDTFNRHRAVIVLDNAQWADPQSLQLIEHMLNTTKPVALWIILAYRTEEIDGKPLQDFVERWRSRSGTTRLTLKPFGPKATLELIQQMLGTSPILRQLSARILCETEGNPLLIKDIVNALQSQGHLYLDENGHWRTGFDIEADGIVLPIPNDIYEAALNQIASLPGDSRAVLQALSAFISAAPLEALQEACDISRDRLTEILNELISLQLVDERNDDRGYAYEIRLRSIKRGLYDFMAEEQKHELHSRIAKALESLPNRDDPEVSHELVFHLKKAGELSRALSVALACAESLLEIGIDSQAQPFLIEAYKAAKNLQDHSQTLRVLFMLSETYERLGEYEKALETYKEALGHASEMDNTEAKALAMQGIGLLQVRMNNIEAASESLYKALELAKFSQSEEAVLKATYSLCVMMLSQQRYDEIIKLASECLSSYTHNEFLHMRGLLENLIGASYDSKGRSADAIKRYEESIRLFNASGRHWEAARPINNIGNMYNDHLQMPERARGYYEQALEIVKKYGQPAIMETLLNNIGETYRALDQHPTALEYYHEAEKLSLESERHLVLFVCRVNMILSYMIIGDYRKSCHYLRLAQAEIEKHGDAFERYFDIFRKYAATLFYVIGDFERASEYLNKGSKKCGVEESQCDLNLHGQALRLCIDYAKTGVLDLDRMDQIISEYRHSNYIKDYRTWLHAFADLLINAGELEKAASLISESEQLASKSDTPRLSAELYLLKGQLSQGDTAVDLIYRSIECCKGLLYPLLEFKAHKALGDALYCKGDLLCAASAYSSAIDILYSLASNVPEEYQKAFILSHDRHEVRERLLSIRKSLLEKELAATSDEENLDITYDSSPLGKFFRFMQLRIRLSGEDLCESDVSDSSQALILDFLGEMLDSPPSNYQYGVERILSALAEITGADTACLFLEENDSVVAEFSVGAAPSGTELQCILDRARSEPKGILIKEQLGVKPGQVDLTLPDGVRAVICIPLLEGVYEDSSFKHDQRRPRSRSTRSVLGYLYLSSSSVFSQFNGRTLRVCRAFASIARILVENQHLRLISSIDKVSGVYTRKYFEQAIANELHKAARGHYPLSLIMIDVDEFKSVNDTFGHQRGDEILRELGRVLRENIRPQDICCRYGGEEFAILLPDTSEEDAMVVAERLRTAVESAKLMGTSMTLTISLGVATYPTHGEWQDELVSRADQALYQAKQLGRNSAVLWNPSIGGTAKRTDRLAGIVTGNTVQDQRNVLAMIEMIDVIHQPIEKEGKIYLLLGKAINILDAELGSLVVLEEDGFAKRTRTFTRRSQDEGWVSEIICSQQIIENVLSSGESIYCVDWDHVHGLDPVSGDPIWHSVIAVPIKRDKSLLGVLCLSTSITRHEYGSGELNFAETIGEIVALAL